ncbi:penicillin amidase domain protein [Leptospira weilii str. Ecochallenge]|uniref:Penicillin amidase domain protein n=1 Tax=Leptospira weilii str. Ecochallenge TaxID=1049986 RepID=N1TWF8_9LEPT|nr:penicillin amidase domain protein [Leptospira weilii str. Ecochallenge]
MEKTSPLDSQVFGNYFRFDFFVKLGFVFLIFWKAPRLSGELTVPGLTKPVSVVRDSYGVPHIRSEDSSSAYFALGYVSASDRLFQMEILRRAARGNYPKF